MRSHLTNEAMGNDALYAVADELLERSRSSLCNAYAPYSNFPVAAAVMDEAGRIFNGVNVENASLGLTMCAERVAIFSAIAAGAKRIKAIAVVAEKIEAVSPCGACRQVMSEFADPDTPVFLGANNSRFEQTSVEGLLPRAFVPKQLKGDL